LFLRKHCIARLEYVPIQQALLRVLYVKDSSYLKEENAYVHIIFRKLNIRGAKCYEAVMRETSPPMKGFQNLLMIALR
jgi:hypothetical protein